MISLPLVLVAVLPTIWIVDASNGPGTNFTSLPGGVAAAASGDTLVVRPGIYAPFSVSGKALTIRGAGSATTVVTATSSTQQTIIAAIPAGSTFYVSGMAFSVAPAATPVTLDRAARVSGPGEVVIGQLPVVDRRAGVPAVWGAGLGGGQDSNIERPGPGLQELMARPKWPARATLPLPVLAVALRLL